MIRNPRTFKVFSTADGALPEDEYQRPCIVYAVDDAVYKHHVVADAHTQFEKSAVRHRVIVRIGRIVRLLSTSRRVPRAQRFAGHPHIVDLATTDAGWPLRAGESAVLFSNEWISLPTDTMGIIASRVSNYDKGLVAAPSFLDSLWRGIVKLHVTNTSRHTVWLEPGREVAQLLLVSTESTGDDSFGLAKQANHYGKDWDTILRNDADPFIHGTTRPDTSVAARIHRANTLLKNYAGYGLLALLVTGMFAAINIYARIDEPIDNAARVPALEGRVDDMQGRGLRTGVHTVDVAAGAAEGTSSFALDNLVVRDTTFVDAYIADRPSDARVAVALVRRANQPFIELTVRLADPVPEMARVDVKWLVAP